MQRLSVMNSLPFESGTHPNISVIVPVYKVEKYIRECIESVLSQSFKDFELILVDDGSPDRCGEICDELAKKDSRIRVFHQENGGVTSARRLGVGKARAEWICFVDSDDILPENALEDLFSAMERFGDEVDYDKTRLENLRTYSRDFLGDALKNYIQTLSP